MGIDHSQFVLVNLQSEQMIHSVNKQHIGRKPRPRINIMQRCSIVANLKCGISVSSICQETGTSRATVFRIMKSWKSGAIPNAQKKQLGRPKKTTTEQDAFIVDAVENNRKMVPRLVQRMLLEIYGVRLSLSRIRYRLQIAGLDGHICVRKPLLSDTNKAKRELWAYRHRNWTYEQWKKVLWSDEKKFELFNSKRRQHCRRRKGEALRDDTIQATVKHGGGSAMFWGCFAGKDVGDIFKIDGIMRKEEYHSILVHHAMPSGKRLFGNENWIFQQDNDPKHSSKLCQNYLARKEEAGQMTTMEWPPQSPDLSPIELLWEQMDREVLEKKPSSVAELVKVVKECWAEISGDVCDKLVKRMPLLCRAVIDAKGGYFDEKLAPQKKQLVYH